jgi:hypothetical protein
MQCQPSHALRLAPCRGDRHVVGPAACPGDCGEDPHRGTDVRLDGPHGGTLSSNLDQCVATHDASHPVVWPRTCVHTPAHATGNAVYSRHPVDDCVPPHLSRCRYSHVVLLAGGIGGTPLVSIADRVCRTGVVEDPSDRALLLSLCCNADTVATDLEAGAPKFAGETPASNYAAPCGSVTRTSLPVVWGR